MRYVIGLIFGLVFATPAMADIEDGEAAYDRAGDFR